MSRFSKYQDRWIKKWLAYRHLRVGRRGEELACKFLRQRGYFIWKRNWRCRHGELDIIAYNNNVLRFIEVKTRSLHTAFDFPAIEAVDKAKTKRLERLAYSFVLRRRKAMRLRRLTSYVIDVITVLVPERIFSSPAITHIQNISEGFRSNRN